MFVVRKLFNSVLGTTANAELVNLPSGRLFLCRPNQTLKTAKECIFIDASISIRRTAIEHQYQLVVTRAFGEGEEGLLEENAENESERVFLVTEELAFAVNETSPEPGEPEVPTLSWHDIAGDETDRFEFALDASTPPDRIVFFEGLMYRCMWERKYRRDSAEADDEELDRFRIEPARTDASAKALFREPTPEAESDDEVSRQLADLSVTAPSPAAKSKGKSRESAGSIENAQVTPGQVRSDADRKPAKAEMGAVWTQECQLHLFDKAVAAFLCQDDQVQATLWVPNQKGELCWLTVMPKEGTQPWVSTSIGTDQNLAFKEGASSMIFNYTYERGDVRDTYTWLLRFASAADFALAQEAFTQTLINQNFGPGAWDKLAPVERQYSKEAFSDEDIEMFDADEERRVRAEEERIEEEERLAREQAEQQETASEESESEESSNEEAANFRSPTKAKAKARVSSGGAGKQNSQLAVGYRGDLSFVVRGDMIGIFQSQTTGSKKLKFMTSIQGLTSPDGKKAFEPTKVMLHNQDSTMVLKDPRNPYSLFRLDLNTGKVVEEWKVSDAFEVKNFLPKTKFAQMDPEQTLVGTSANGIFRIDPRLSGSKLVDSEFKQYATKADFSTAATTETGRLAVASNKGDLRLYDAIGKNAKTALPALGDPIVGVDVSADGRYIVATTKTYLLFIDTLITEGRYKGSSGFDRSFPATAKPKPVRLALRQEHMAYMDHNVSFTPAKFNQGPNELEKTIVTSTGPFIVAFNVRRLIQGKVDYTIKKYGQNIVADNFRFGNDRDIITVMPGDVFQASKKDLLRPTRESLAPDARRGEGIVQSWRG